MRRYERAQGCSDECNENPADIVADLLAVDWSGGSWAHMTTANVPETVPIPEPEPAKKRKRRGDAAKFFDRKKEAG